MVVAATYKDEKVYQHFGSTPHFKIYEVGEDGGVSVGVIDTDKRGHKPMVDLLLKHEVTDLICDDLGAEAYKLLDEAGIRIYAGYEDYADVCFLALLKGNLIRATEAVCQDKQAGCGGECGDDCECGGDCSSCH